MTFWWLNNIARANHEREELARLAEKSDWIKTLYVTLGDGNISAEIDIEHGDTVYELVLSYPVVFPDAPPLIKSRDGQRISGHQYGASGELCLEYRPDNWNASITGATMVESAYKLLSGENPQQGAGVGAIIDGHAASIGQATRSASCRFVESSSDRAAFQALAVNVLYDGSLSDVWLEKKLSARLLRIGTEDTAIYTSESKFAAPVFASDAFIIRKPSTPIPVSPKIADIEASIASAENNTEALQKFNDPQNFYLLDASEESRLFWVCLKVDEPFVIPFRTLKQPGHQNRLPAGLDFAGKKIGIVGCGSLGSKVATQLARTGTGSLVLFDDDVFFEGNLVRNELSVADIGFHKSQALRKRLLAISPGLIIETRQVRLGGQEASESIVTAMKQLSECDLVIEATADPAAFNIVSSVCKRAKIPAVWGSVFAGGIGGIVARARPDRDPEPLEARQQIKRWCDAQGVEPPDTTDNAAEYEALGEDGEPVVATDADVSVIAAHVTRLAIDTLGSADQSNYPYSAYIVGLTAQWIFSAPFDTRPIEYTNQGAWASEGEVATPEELANFLKLVLPVEAESGA